MTKFKKNIRKSRKRPKDNFLAVLVNLGTFLLLLMPNGIKFLNEQYALYKKKREEEDEKRRELEWHQKKQEQLKWVEQVEELLPALDKAITDFSLNTTNAAGYFNNFKFMQWQQTANSISIQVKTIPFHALNLAPAELSSFNEFTNIVQNAANLKNAFNKNFLQYELTSYSHFFDDIEGRRLDLQQRTCIITDEDNNIVVAGAGSGKTTTIAGKVAYLLHRFNIAPSEILLISFTRKASEEMRNRIKLKMKIDINVMTFHKLGRTIIGKATNDLPSVFEESKLPALINGFLVELMGDHNYSAKFTKYLTQFLKPQKGEEEFQSHGEYIQFIKDNNIKCFKQKEGFFNGRTTMLREQCKSVQEVTIANFLFLNNVNYEYERPYEIKTSDSTYAQYKPDFYLIDYGIYLEHFGIDRNGNVPQWFSGDGIMNPSQKYKTDMEWKRETHQKHKTKLVESFSYDSMKTLY